MLSFSNYYKAIRTKINQFYHNNDHLSRNYKIIA